MGARRTGTQWAFETGHIRFLRVSNYQKNPRVSLLRFWESYIQLHTFWIILILAIFKFWFVGFSGDLIGHRCMAFLTLFFLAFSHYTEHYGQRYNLFPSCLPQIIEACLNDGLAGILRIFNVFLRQWTLKRHCRKRYNRVVLSVQEVFETHFSAMIELILNSRIFS